MLIRQNVNNDVSKDPQIEFFLLFECKTVKKGITASHEEDDKLDFFSNRFILKTVICQHVVENKAKLRAGMFAGRLKWGKNNRRTLLVRPKDGRCRI